jgi:hypothetical protein
MDIATILTTYLFICIAWAILSIGMMIWAYKRKGVVGLLLALFLNWIGWIIVLCLPRDDKKPERERAVYSD